MIASGQTLHFGKHTLILLMFRRTVFAFGMFIISGAISFIGPYLANIIATLTVLGGSSNQTIVNRIASSISYFDMALFLISIIFGMLGIIIALLEYKNHTFQLDELSVNVKQGIINQLSTSLPYRQIRDIHVTRTALHQLFGTSRLTLITMGHEEVNNGKDVDEIFDPIDADVAENIREFLESKIGVQIIQQVNQQQHA